MKSIIKSYVHEWKVTNDVMYCDTRTDAYTHTRRPTLKKKYITIVILIVLMIRRINDFTIITLVHIILILITNYDKVTYKCFIYFVCQVNYSIYLVRK